MELECEAKKVVNYVNSLGLGIPSRQPSHGHIGAIIADAVLQIGHDYERQVANRVVRLREQYPEAATLSGFLCLLGTVGAQKLLDGWKGRKEHKRLYDHATFFAGRINTFDELSVWLQDDRNRDSLIMGGLGIRDKTADYYRVLVRLPDAVKVDKRVEMFLVDAGIDRTKYAYKDLRTIIQMVAIQLNVRPIDLDSAIWSYKGGKEREGKKMNEENRSGEMGKDSYRLPVDKASKYLRELKKYDKEVQYIEGLEKIFGATASVRIRAALYMEFLQKIGQLDNFKTKFWSDIVDQESQRKRQKIVKEYEMIAKAFPEYLRDIAKGRRQYDELGILEGSYWCDCGKKIPQKANYCPDCGKKQV